MGSHSRRLATWLTTLSFIFLVIVPGLAADQEIDRQLRSPIGRDWVTNGGNLTNQRFSTLNQIDPSNVAQLKGAWMARLNGSGFGAKYSLEASPLVKNGIMYVITGNNDVFALNAKTGAILWEHWSDVHQKISALCCGWVNRGLAMGEGLLFFGQLDANVVALDMKTGKVAWKTSIEKWENGYSITSAPLYYDGIVYSGIAGGEYGVRGRLTALDAKTGAILWRWFTVPGPGEFGSDTWPPGTDHAMRGGATVWNTPALDPELGLIYFVTGNCGPNHDGSMREGDNLFCSSMIALKAKTGQYVWHFQQVHHDLWNYDASSPMVLFDTVINGQPRKGIAEAGHTGWLYILDRTNGKPLIGIEERPVPQEPRQKTAKTQPFPLGDATVPQCADLLPGYDKAGCIFEPFWENPVLVQPSGDGGTNWSPVPYSPDTGYFYVSGTVRTSAYTRSGTRDYVPGRSYGRGSQVTPIGSPMSGTFTAIASTTNKIVWQHKTPYRLGGGATVTAGGLVFRGEPDGNLLALDAKTGKELWRFQTGFGADAPPVVYEVDGEQYVAIATGGNRLQGSAYGDAVWAFSLKGQLGPLWPPPPPSTVGGPSGLPQRWPGILMASKPIETGVVTVKIGANNEEYSFSPVRIQITAGTTITFTNLGNQIHNATPYLKPEWDTGDLATGESKAISFTRPGVYYYLCTPHPWMYGQIIVE
ncbi:MAG: quinonprotein alcohol dehydrogenase [Candidatus Rokuibacteriota bacterium]|nr:MAG: quinonprotein alcohol dehydrogenase [Candidatus Rokubacteria bacterium]